MNQIREQLKRHPERLFYLFSAAGTIGRELGKSVGGKVGGKFGKTLGGNLAAQLGRSLMGTFFK